MDSQAPRGGFSPPITGEVGGEPGRPRQELGWACGCWFKDGRRAAWKAEEGAEKVRPQPADTRISAWETQSRGPRDTGQAEPSSQVGTGDNRSCWQVSGDVCSHREPTHSSEGGAAGNEKPLVRG